MTRPPSPGEPPEAWRDGPDARLTGYGDEGAELLVARFIAEHWERFEPKLWAMKVNPHIFQRWLRRHLRTLWT
jgi:hypothetical protein